MWRILARGRASFSYRRRRLIIEDASGAVVFTRTYSFRSAFRCHRTFRLLSSYRNDIPRKLLSELVDPDLVMLIDHRFPQNLHRSMRYKEDQNQQEDLQNRLWCRYETDLYYELSRVETEAARQPRTIDKIYNKYIKIKFLFAFSLIKKKYIYIFITLF